MGQKTYEMLAKPRLSLRKYGAASAALAVSLLAASYARAQEPAAPPSGASQAAGAGQSSTSQPRPSSTSGLSSFVDSQIPGFQFGATIDLSETYATNATGLSTAGQDDWLTLVALNTNMHEHSRRVSFDATYAGAFDYYARSSQHTQFINDLQAVGNIIAVPDYLNFVAKAFAQPVVISNVGVVTANGNVVPNGYRNSYGYSAGPDITFHLGDFATSETNATYGGAYFINPAGSSNFVIPGVNGPEDTVMRSATEKLSSGTDFSRLKWTAIGLFSETARPQGLLSEKAGTGNFEYAISHEISLLATGGYDAISNTVRLTKDVTGPVAMGGFALTFGDDFSLRVEAGEKYNSASYQGFLHWNLSPTSIVTGSATDTITTPEGQLLDSLSDLTATQNGTLTSASDIYANGSAASLASFSAQPSGSLSYTQTIARYQRVSLGYSQDFERDHANITFYGLRQTILDRAYLGPPVNNSWGALASLSHDISRLTIATIGGGYAAYQELGGHADTVTVNGQLAYSLSPDTRVYFRTDYLTRTSSMSLQTLSPFTGSLDDLRLTIGFSHAL